MNIVSLRDVFPGRTVQLTPLRPHDCKRAVTKSGGYRAALDPTRMFLVKGHLNARYIQSGRNPVVVYTMRDGENTEQSWRCMLALKGGRFYAPELPTDGLSIANMWLDITGRHNLNQEKGFLKRILVASADRGYWCLIS